MPHLTVSRKSDESIILYTSDGPIEIKLGDTAKSAVKVHVNAPESVHVFRSELIDTALRG